MSARLVWEQQVETLPLVEVRLSHWLRKVYLQSVGQTSSIKPLSFIYTTAPETAKQIKYMSFGMDALGWVIKRSGFTLLRLSIKVLLLLLLIFQNFSIAPDSWPEHTMESNNVRWVVCTSFLYVNHNLKYLVLALYINKCLHPKLLFAKLHKLNTQI